MGFSVIVRSGHLTCKLEILGYLEAASSRLSAVLDPSSRLSVVLDPSGRLSVVLDPSSRLSADLEGGISLCCRP